VFIGADRPHCPGKRLHKQYIDEELDAVARERISMLGRLPDEEVDHWLQRGTIFVAPSIYESFGLVFLEAMRWGTPVIGTYAGGIPEIIEDDVTGVLVPANRPDAIALAIVKLLENPSRCRELGEAGRRRCMERFMDDRMAADMIHVYKEAIERWRR
jgi:glycosyltransferase involved in cell wall biosynthesis